MFSSSASISINYRQRIYHELNTKLKMCEIIRQNFEEKYPQIIDDLHSATFIAIDCEFSGLFDEKFKHSLFDTPEARYKKMQSTLENFAILEFGLTTFQYDRNQNRFKSSSYSFFLFPSPFFKPQSAISCQLSSFEFLSRHQFDFNKVFKDGINYLRKSDEAEALKMIEENSLIENVDREHLQDFLREISEWNERENEGSETFLNVENERDVFVLVLHQEARKRFSNIWTHYDEKGSFRIEKVSEERKSRLIEDKKNVLQLKKKLLNSLLGFSKIIKEMENLKKPIVGHNFLLDLIMIYKQFYSMTPISYKQFKKNIHRIFPNIYDTKYISFNLMKVLPKNSIWMPNTLSGLYHYLRYGEGATVVLFTPNIISNSEEFVKSGHFHDAAFDSFCTGFCFVKMAHIYSLWDENAKTLATTSIMTNSTWLLAAVERMKNFVNLPRSQVNNIILDGQDPKSGRPGPLFIQTKNGNPLDIVEISEIIGKYVSVDVQLLSKDRGLMAVSNKKQVEDVLESFKNHEHYEIARYNFFKHSNLPRKIFIGAIIVSAICFFVSKSKGYLVKLNRK